MSSEIWHVKLGNGGAQSGSLDQLDEAFQAGLIHEQTLVRREGSEEWITLAQAAGLEEQPETLSVPVNSTAPMAIDTTDLDLDPRQLRSSKRNVVLGLAAALVFGAVGIFSVGSALDNEGTAAATAPPPIVADLNAALKPSSPPEQDKARTLSDDQKRALLEIDKAREADQQKKKAAAASKRGVGSLPPLKQGNPFHKGGNKYDPLNTTL